MRRYRIALVVIGGLLLSFGALRLVTRLDHGDLLALALWMAVAVALHDFVLAPATVGTGVLLTRLPARVRRYAQGGLTVAALITVVALPLIARRNTQPAVKAILLRDYAGNLALLLGLTLAITVVLFLIRLLRDGGTPDSSPEDPDL